MGVPRTSSSRYSHSIGDTRRLVTIQSVTEDGQWAVCTDRKGFEARVPMLILPGKGVLPAAGENWYISQDSGSTWTFTNFVGASTAQLPDLPGTLPITWGPGPAQTVIDPDGNILQYDASGALSSALANTATSDAATSTPFPAALGMFTKPVLVYNGPPAKGNLIASIAGKAGSDGLGNSWTPGVNATQGSIATSMLTGSIPTSMLTGFINASQITGTLPGSTVPNTGSILSSNSYFTGGDLSYWASYGGLLAAAQPAGRPFPWTARVTATGTAAFGLIGTGANVIPVTPQSQYMVTGWIELNGSGPQYQVGMNWLTASGAPLSASVATGALPGTTWTPVATVVTAPANAAYGVPLIGVASATAAGLQAFIAAPLVLPQVPGGLIEVGTITAAQIAAGTIVAGIVDSTLVTGAILQGGVVEGGQILGGLVQAEGAAGGFFSYSSNPGPLNQNFSFATGIAPWAGFDNATVSASGLNTFGQSPGSMIITPDGVTANPGAVSENTIPVTQLNPYGVTAQVTVPLGWASGMRLNIRWFTSGGAFISQSTGPTTVMPAGVQTQLVNTTTAPSTAAFASFVISYVGTPAATVIAYAGLAVFGNNGSLVLSVAGAAGTDQYGNSFPQGTSSYAHSTNTLTNLNGDIVSLGLSTAFQLGQFQLFNELAMQGVVIQSGKSLSGDTQGWIAALNSEYTSPGGGGPAVVVGKGSITGALSSRVFQVQGNQTVGIAFAWQPGSGNTTEEGWNALGTLTGATVNIARYRLLADGMVYVQIDVTFGVATAVSTITFSNTIPAAWQPLSGTTDVRAPMAQTNSSGSLSRIFVGMAGGGSPGQVQMAGFTGNYLGTYSATFQYPII